MYDSVIIGSGPAGLTAAIYLSRAGLKNVIISGTLPGGQLTSTTDVENFPGFPKGISGFQLMEDMALQAANFGTETLKTTVTSIDFDSRPFKIHLKNNSTLETRSIILSTGSTAKYLGIENEIESIGNGVSACATCDGFFYKNKEVAVLGGGDTAIEEALYLANICSRVYIIHRRDEFRAAPVTLEKARANAKIEFITSATIKQAYGDKAGLAGLIINTKEGERDLKVPGVFVFVGLNVNNDVLRQENGEFVCQTEAGGQVSVDLKMQTSVPGLFAAGDIRKDAPKQVIVAASDGAMAALSALSYIESLH